MVLQYIFFNHGVLIGHYHTEVPEGIMRVQYISSSHLLIHVPKIHF